VSCSIYQDTFNRNGDDSLSAHFLQYATIAANLTPKMSELDVIDVIGGHYLNYIQHALLSASVRTLRQALNFLTKLQIMEDGEARRSSSRESIVSRSGHDSPVSQNQNGNYRQIPQPRSIRYPCYRESSRYEYNRQNDRHAASQVQQTDTLQQRQ
jgi:hypothetical protein